MNPFWLLCGSEILTMLLSLLAPIELGLILAIVGLSNPPTSETLFDPIPVLEIPVEPTCSFAEKTATSGFEDKGLAFEDLLRNQTEAATRLRERESLRKTCTLRPCLVVCFVDTEWNGWCHGVEFEQAATQTMSLLCDFVATTVLLTSLVVILSEVLRNSVTDLSNFSRRIPETWQFYSLKIRSLIAPPAQASPTILHVDATDYAKYLLSNTESENGKPLPTVIYVDTAVLAENLKLQDAISLAVPGLLVKNNEMLKEEFAAKYLTETNLETEMQSCFNKHDLVQDNTIFTITETILSKILSPPNGSSQGNIGKAQNKLHATIESKAKTAVKAEMETCEIDFGDLAKKIKEDKLTTLKKSMNQTRSAAEEGDKSVLDMRLDEFQKNCAEGLQQEINAIQEKLNKVQKAQDGFDKRAEQAISAAIKPLKLHLEQSGADLLGKTKENNDLQTSKINQDEKIEGLEEKINSLTSAKIEQDKKAASLETKVIGLEAKADQEQNDLDRVFLWSRDLSRYIENDEDIFADLWGENKHHIDKVEAQMKTLRLEVRSREKGDQQSGPVVVPIAEAKEEEEKSAEGGAEVKEGGADVEKEVGKGNEEGVTVEEHYVDNGTLEQEPIEQDTVEGKLLENNVGEEEQAEEEIVKEEPAVDDVMEHESTEGEVFEELPLEVTFSRTPYNLFASPAFAPFIPTTWTSSSAPKIAESTFRDGPGYLIVGDPNEQIQELFTSRGRKHRRNLVYKGHAVQSLRFVQHHDPVSNRRRSISGGESISTMSKFSLLIEDGNHEEQNVSNDMLAYISVSDRMMLKKNFNFLLPASTETSNMTHGNSACDIHKFTDISKLTRCLWQICLENHSKLDYLCVDNALSNAKTPLTKKIQQAVVVSSAESVPRPVWSGPELRKACRMKFFTGTKTRILQDWAAAREPMVPDHPTSCPNAEFSDERVAISKNTILNSRSSISFNVRDPAKHYSQHRVSAALPETKKASSAIISLPTTLAFNSFQQRQFPGLAHSNMPQIQQMQRYNMCQMPHNDLQQNTLPQMQLQMHPIQQASSPGSFHAVGQPWPLKEAGYNSHQPPPTLQSSFFPSVLNPAATKYSPSPSAH